MMLAEVATNREIGDRVGPSGRKARKQVSAILSEPGSRNRTEAAVDVALRTHGGVTERDGASLDPSR